jgi:hypothetical protein
MVAAPDNIGIRFQIIGTSVYFVVWHKVDGIKRSLAIMCLLAVVKVASMLSLNGKAIYWRATQIDLLIEPWDEAVINLALVNRLLPILEPPVFWQYDRPWINLKAIHPSQLVIVCFHFKTAFVTEEFAYTREGTEVLAAYLMRRPYCPYDLFLRTLKMPRQWALILRYAWSLVECMSLEPLYQAYMWNFMDDMPSATFVSNRVSLTLPDVDSSAFLLEKNGNCSAVIVSSDFIRLMRWAEPFVFKSYLRANSFGMLRPLSYWDKKSPKLLNVKLAEMPKKSINSMKHEWKSLVIVRIQTSDVSFLAAYSCVCVLVAALSRNRKFFSLYDISFDVHYWGKKCEEISQVLLSRGEVIAVWNGGAQNLDSCGYLLWSRPLYDYLIPELPDFYQWVAAECNQELDDMTVFSPPRGVLVFNSSQIVAPKVSRSVYKCPAKNKKKAKKVLQAPSLTEDKGLSGGGLVVISEVARKNLAGLKELSRVAYDKMGRPKGYYRFVLPKFKDPYMPEHPYGRSFDGSIWKVYLDNRGRVKQKQVRPPSDKPWPPGVYRPQ